MVLDPAIVRSLSLDPSRTTVSTYGNSGFASTAKIKVSSDDGSERYLFMKIGRGDEKAVMFAGEYQSLKAIRGVVPSFCPTSLAFGELEENPGTHFLVTEFRM
jgi:protein-ribulosamine 3-kinase